MPVPASPPRCSRPSASRRATASRSPWPTSTASCAASTSTRTSSRRRSKAASASATSCSAGTCRTSATTTRRSPAGTRAFPTRSRASTSARIATCRGTTTCRFLPRRVRRGRRTARKCRFRSCPRQVLKRVLKRAEKLGFTPMCGMEFEWFNFAETPQSWADKKGVGPTPITPGMFGYSLLRANHSRDVLQGAVRRDGARSAFRSKACTPRPGPGVYEAAILFSEALEAADRAMLFKTAREGDRRALRHHAELHGEVERSNIPGCSGHCPPVAVRRQEEPSSTTPRAARR